MPQNIILVFLIGQFVFVNSYDYSLFRDEREDVCSNRVCKDNETHSICFQNISSAPPHFEYLEITPMRKAILINGVNGIRNRIAREFKISNMNILHWDVHLFRMAKGFLSRRIIGPDSCDYIGKKRNTVGQTYYFNPKPPLNRFVVTIMRLWFFETSEISTFEEFMQKKPPNMTQMTYPQTEFVGCAAAKMQGGYMLRCYYSPAFIDNSSHYMRGKSCTACPNNRFTCSRIFKGLCGIDIPLPSSRNRKYPTNFNIFSSLLTLWVSFIIYY